VKRILFVDDESKIIDGIRRMMHADRKRWDMQFVASGEAALQACEACAFDVVISDMRMPGMDGATLLGKIRDRFPGTARIVLTGYSEQALAVRSASVAHRVLAKPCTALELQTAIERVCALQDVLCAPEIRRVIGAVGELPSLSSTYSALTTAVRDPNTSLSRVTEIVQQDIAMSAKVLQLVNSAFFGLAQRVNSLQGAVTYLGMETIKNLALVSETFRVFVPDARIPRAFCESIQTHSHRVGAIAGALPLDRKIREFTIIAALLHDVGRLILASKMPDEFCSSLSRAGERHCELFEAEEEVFGTSHAEIGAYLLGLWGIPSEIVEAIAHHHHPTRIPHVGFDSAAAVYVADLLAHELQLHPQDLTGAELHDRDRAALETLGCMQQYAEFRDMAIEGCR
jgi:putative nucleotidyltransferase with HDIG domain